MSGNARRTIRWFGTAVGIVVLEACVSGAPVLGMAHGQEMAESMCMSAARSVAPPPGFTPVTASAAQLKCYGFPPRPIDDSEALGRWTRLMSHARVYVAPVFKTVRGLIFPPLTRMRHGVRSSADLGWWAGAVPMFDHGPVLAEPRTG
jgi:hypothetical protein